MARPDIDSRTLLGRFVDGSDVEGIDLKASVANTSWEALDQQTCRLLLINTVALYEGWCHEFSNTFNHFGVITQANQRTYQDSLQWPDVYRGSSRLGIETTISTLQSRDSVSQGMATLMSRMQVPAVKASFFGARMRAYRVFKVARNSIAHRGTVATDELCAAYSDYQNIRPGDLGMRVVPTFITPVLGNPVALSWRGIIGLADMLRRIVVDVDHSLMNTKTAERDLAERLRIDSAILDDPTQANSVIKHDHWAKLPGGPWIVLKDQLAQGQRAVFQGVKQLLDVPTARTQDLLTLWPALLTNGAVEVHLNLGDISN